MVCMSHIQRTIKSMIVIVTTELVKNNTLEDYLNDEVVFFYNQQFDMEDKENTFIVENIGSEYAFFEGGWSV